MTSEETWRCKNCRKTLPADHRDPCPRCGSTKRVIHATATITAQTQTSITLTGETGTTGRATTLTSDDEDVPHGPVKEFIEWLNSYEGDPPWDEVLDHPIAQEILQDCSDAASTGLEGRLYRGQRLAEGSDPKVDRLLAPTDERLPENVKPGPGRYNEGGDPVLYTCRTQDILPDEVPIEDTDEPELHVIELDVSIDDIKVLRMHETVEEDQPHLHNLLYITEYPEETKDIDVYRATHLVREICRRLDIDAVEYPSVKGGYRDDKEALNLAVFDEAIEQVEACVDGEPYRVDG